MAPAFGRSPGERAKAAAAVAALHLLLGAALVAGFGVRFVAEPETRLRLFDVAEPPPPEPSPPAETPSDDAAGAASPPNLKASPPPNALLPKPVPVPPGPDVSAGSADVPGEGTGTAGPGSGTGAGGEGDGPGGGARRAERIGGAISGATDYPPAARRAGIEGSVRVRYVVGADGRVRDCRVVRSSGHAELDSTTCRLAEQRFRYRPALDARGRPVPETVSRTFDWLLPPRR